MANNKISGSYILQSTKFAEYTLTGNDREAELLLLPQELNFIDLSNGTISGRTVDFMTKNKIHVKGIRIVTPGGAGLRACKNAGSIEFSLYTFPELNFCPVSFFTSIGNPFPAVCIRTSRERPEALDKACFVLAGIDEKSLLQAVITAVEMNDNGDYGIPVPDYVEEIVSTKVVKLIQSYTGVVNKMVWRKTED